MKKALISFFGGYAWLGFLALVVAVGGLSLEFQRRGDKITQQAEEMKAKDETIQQGNNTIQALTGRGARKDRADAADKSIEKEIDDAQDGKDCAGSEPIVAVLDGLSNRAKQTGPDTQ